MIIAGAITLVLGLTVGFTLLFAYADVYVRLFGLALICSSTLASLVLILARVILDKIEKVDGRMKNLHPDQ